MSDRYLYNPDRSSGQYLYQESGFMCYSDKYPYLNAYFYSYKNSYSYRSFTYSYRRQCGWMGI